MPPTDPNRSAPATQFSRRNILILAVAVITIVAGYAVLSSGSAETASVLLVVGYCVLFPLALLV
jgi:predicted Rossmann fold nucleotide-binding protein DprA/Smf involved in DNA uptake